MVKQMGALMLTSQAVHFLTASYGMITIRLKTDL